MGKIHMGPPLPELNRLTDKRVKTLPFRTLRMRAVKIKT